MTIRSGTTGWDITTDRLQVRVAKPGFVYRRTRFDWSGFVTDVVLDGRHTFCSVESLHPLEGAGGIGLCSEFGIREPVGYEEAGVGEPFPKLGVGVLTKPDDSPYTFMRDYPLAMYPCTTTLLEDGIRFAFEPLPCRGYAVRYVKTLTVSGNTLRMAYHLENVGGRPIETTEYNHNFLQLDSAPIGPGYRLVFSSPLAFRRNDESLWSDTGVLDWPEPTRGFYGLCLEVPGMDAAAGVDAGPDKGYEKRDDIGDMGWTLQHAGNGLSVSEHLDVKPVRVACWGMPHVVSPEMFVQVHLLPGQTQEWSRAWTFQFAEG